MKLISLQDLPQWSEWPTRLLGLSPWKVADRTVEKIDSEYDKDKYARCLTYLEGGSGGVTPEDVKQFEFASPSEERICVSVGNELYEATLAEARAMYYSLLLEELSPEIARSNSVVELGAGYGYNLWMLRERFKEKSFVGGEYSANATRIASTLYSRLDGLSVQQFNFYVPESYGFIGRLKPPVLVFTSHAIEQLPRSAPLVDGLLPYRNSIGAVIHFEPLHERSDVSLLQLFRRRYTEVNDYNRDLISELRGRPYVTIASIRDNVYGLNPLNPSSVIRWSFV